MEFPKQIKDTVYSLLQEPNLDHFREFLKGETGEHNAIDFKQEWIQKDKLAKLMLALANYGGGIIVFGVRENEDKTFSCDGLPELQAKEQIGSWVKSYISPNLKYDIYDFSYQTSEYEVLNGKQFQILVVEDTPEFLPFISRKEGSNIKLSTIYIRRGTSDEQATEEELNGILQRRIKYLYPTGEKSLTLEQHLQQLETLYKQTDQKIRVKCDFFQGVGLLATVASMKYQIKANSFYPKESYEEFIAKMIEEKKNKIRRVLDLH